MAFTIEKDTPALYPSAPQYEYVIKENENRYGVDRTESGYDLYLIDYDNIPIADGRDTQEWSVFYSLGWTKQELHNQIKDEWKSSLLPPYGEMEAAVKELYGEEYEGIRIENLDGNELDSLYEKFLNNDKEGSIHDGVPVLSEKPVMFVQIFPGANGNLKETTLEDAVDVAQSFSEYTILGFIKEKPEDVFDKRFTAVEVGFDGTLISQYRTYDSLNEGLMDEDVFSNFNKSLMKTPVERLTHDNALSQQDFSSLEELNEWEENWQKNNFAHVKIPAAFLTPHTMTAKDGREFDKAFVSFPKGTKINGVDISGFSCDIFMSDRMKQQMLNGETVTLSFKGNQPVSIWTGKKDSEQYPYKQFHVKPWDLVKGIKQQMQDYKESKEAERQGKANPLNSLSSQAKDARSSSDALAHKDNSAPSTPEHYK
ncbi:hypothetical protein KP756_00750 [Streptococcus equi subsp. zooepidemicus]|uniref:hypothetical protein n=1 Tax=Streptococcus equi TaxID=1336 RepID=UPI001E372649|nr:hypothetical protein [Streptococcus equi]MCD3369068.1 hypothetical protein [Streptococcus equi subsp. zooepidemicus]